LFNTGPYVSVAAYCIFARQTSIGVNVVAVVTLLAKAVKRIDRAVAAERRDWFRKVRVVYSHVGIHKHSCCCVANAQSRLSCELTGAHA
jgi:hypothetical protein